MQAGYVRDVEELLDAYAQLNVSDFSSFRTLWSSRHFTLIHEGRPAEMSPKSYMQILYSSALSRLGNDHPLSARIGALYTLYCLVHTQNSEKWPKVLIYTSLRDTKNLVHLAQQIRECQLAPALQILHRLVKGGEGEAGAFLYGAIDCSTLTAAAKLAELEEMAKLKVKAAKNKLFATLPLHEHIEQPMSRHLVFGAEEALLKDYERLLANLLASERKSGFPKTPMLVGELRGQMAAWDSRVEAAQKRKPLTIEGPSREEAL